MTEGLVDLIGRRVPVLDRGYVELQDLMPHPNTGVTGDTAIVAAARVSFLGESKGPEKDRKLIHFLLRNEHTSPFEMVEFKLKIHAPLVTYWQLVRHRTFSLNLMSGRYTEFKEDEFYVPAVWRRQAASNKQASEGEIDPADGGQLTRDLVEHYERSYQLYEKALAKGVAREIARLFLPGFAVYYTGIIKVDLHNLFRFIRLRTASDAQYEIRAYASAIFEHFVRPAVPMAAEAFEEYVLKRKAP